MNSVIAEICIRRDKEHRKMAGFSIFDKLTGLLIFRQCHLDSLESTLGCMAADHRIAHDVSNWIAIRGKGKTHFEGTSHEAYTKYINEYKSQK